jgi:GNAT superfamily N-acetyltransferase
MIEIREVPVSQLNYLSSIPIAFEADSILELCPSESQPAGWVITERKIPPYTKDYDAISDNHPLDWQQQFDLTNWGLLYAFHHDERIGAALIAFRTSGVDMLEGNADLAVLWDIRVAKAWRGKRIGTALFNAVKAWALARKCRELKIETQNNNARAVRFYLRQGCRLKTVNRGAYSNFPEELQLLFYLNL